MRNRWIDEERLISLKGDHVKVRGEGQGKAVSQTASTAQKALDASRPKMNKLEMRYSQFLDVLKFTGDIKDWRFEATKLRLANNCTLTPDFLVITKDGATEYHETKGFLREDSWIKLKVAAETYPWWPFKLVRRIKGEWEIKVV